METRVRWHCMNPACRREVWIEEQAAELREPTKVVCTCGSAMKKDYKPPVFHYLDFLQIDAEEVPSPVREEN